MSPLSFQMTLIGILLTTIFQSGCSARLTNPSAQVASASPTAQSRSSDDQQLITEVEQFTSSDERISDPAWRRLQRHTRSKLVEDLTRISDASTSDDHNRVLIAFTLCSLGHDYSSNRQIVVSALSKKPPFKHLSGDWVVSLIRRLIVKGDHDLVVLLFDASEWSDGAMTMELTHAYSQILVADPATFLRMLSSRPEQTRSQVILLFKDNSLTEDEKKKLKAYLQNVPTQSTFGHLAEEMMIALTD